MKKKAMPFRLAGVLLALVLVTSCFVGGTFAKYVTSGTATDSARVAKWGVEVTATGADAFATEYDGSENPTVKSSTTENVVAPGTKGTLGGIKITGIPEVTVKIEVTADLKLENWTVDGTDYCPLVFKVGSEEVKMNETITTVTDLEEAVEAKLTALSAETVTPNTDLSTGRDVSISWEWPFHVEGNDTKDTALGNAANAGANVPKITFECTATVTQVD